MGVRPNYAIGPGVQCTRFNTANTNRNGSGSITEIGTPGSKGGRLNRINIKAVSSTVAGKVVLFFSSDSGTTWHPWKEINVDAITPSATVSSFEAELEDIGIDMGPTDRLGVSTTIGQEFAATVEIPDF